MTIVTSKRFRVEEHQSSIPEGKHFFNGLPLPIENFIYSFINLSTAHSLLLTNTSFKRIISNFFLYSPSNFNPLLKFIQNKNTKKSFSYPYFPSIKNSNDKDFFSLPPIWQKALNTGLQSLKHIIITPAFFHPNELIQMFSTASKLERIDFFGFCHEYVYVTTASMPNLTELNINVNKFFSNNNITYTIFPIWNCLSLKKLSIFCAPFENIFPNINSNQIILPNLTCLSLSLKYDFNYPLNQLIGCIRSLTELNLKGKFFIIKNEILLKLTNLRSFSYHFFAMQDLEELKNLHSLENLNIIIHARAEIITNIENLNMLAKTIKNLPNLKMVTIEYERYEKYLYSDLDSLPNVHIIINTIYRPLIKLENDSIAKIRSLTLKIQYHFNMYKTSDWDQPQLPTSYYQNVFSQLSVLSGLKDIHVVLFGFSKSHEETLITFFDQLSHKISSIKEVRDLSYKESIWTEKIINQLKNKKLINCTKVASDFFQFDKIPITKNEIFQLFPKLTSENLIGVDKDQFAIMKQRDSTL